MKLNNSFTNLPVEIALGRIIKACKKQLEPIIVVRGDSYEQELRIQKYFNRRRSLCVRLGVACTSERIYSEILHHLSLNPEGDKSLIIQRIKTYHQFKFLVIDNCHRITPRDVFYLLGFTNELSYDLKAVFVFEEKFFFNWSRKTANDPRAHFVLNFVKSLYALPS
jgi:hypothetical protein